MYNLLATSNELIEQKRVLIQKLLDENTIVREENDVLVGQLNALDRIIKVVLDTESKVN